MDDEIDTGYRFNGTENFVGNYDPIQPEETEAIRELRRYPYYGANVESKSVPI